MAFREVSIGDLTDNIFERIGSDWMLLTAGTVEDCNAMTCSWGQMGVLWSKPVATVYVRPSRHTRKFVEEEERFSLSFFAPGTRRNELNLMGSKCGRDGDKFAEAGLHVQAVGGVPAIAEATLVLVCRKLYRQDLLEECFLDKKQITAHYPQKDFHRMYVGEIEMVCVQDA